MKATSYDPFDPDVIGDPYPWYQALRREGVVYCRSREIYVASRYEDVSACLRRHDTFSSAEGVTHERRALPMMLTMDEPEHTRLRRLVRRVFTPSAVERWRRTAEEITRSLLDRALDAGRFDAVNGLASPLPLLLISEILGVKPGDTEEFKTWSDDIVVGFHGVGKPESQVRVAAAVSKLFDYFRAEIAQRRRRPGEDLLSQLLQSTDGERLGEAELLYFCLLLLVAGNETTTNLIGNAFEALIEHPLEWELIREDRSLVPGLVEEALRYDSPIQGFFRTALADHEIAQTLIPKGARVLVSFAAANRDERFFERPDLFSVRRKRRDHLAFGIGIHSCLGASLARLEASVLFDQLFDRVTTIQRDGQATRTRNPMLRGFSRLPVALRPR